MSKDPILRLLFSNVSAGIPVTDKESIFEDTIKEAHYLSLVRPCEIVLSPEVKDLYESENQNNPINLGGISTLNGTELEFVKQLTQYTEKVWSDSNITVSDFHKNLGYSKSKLYRTMMSITGKSPNSFLKDYRLNEALQLMDRQHSNISEIAYRTGFSSPAYFSKCFQEAYGILPSKYSKQIAP